MIGSWVDDQFKLQTVCQQIKHAVPWSVLDLCRNRCVWLSLLKALKIENQWKISPKGDRGEFGESMLKKNVFSEVLAIAFPHCNSFNRFRNSTNNIVNEPIVWVSTSRYIFNIKNYRFANVNVSIRFQSPKGVLILALRTLWVTEISRHCQNYDQDNFRIIFG